jgi:hypothetical protein|tara:strand:+ start:276 stop:776 length:501 start_codon:yes stop_codon:yes gene_type:complete
MFGINVIVKAVSALVIAVLVAVGIWYVSGLKADLAVSTENARQLTAGIAEQQATIATMLADQSKINTINQQLTARVSAQNKDLHSLKNRFTTTAAGQRRDFGTIAARKPGLVEKSINTATADAARCLEIATGSPLTQAEKNAKLPNEINKECPSLFNAAVLDRTGS